MAALMVSNTANAQMQFTQTQSKISVKKLAEQLEVGDIVFIQVDILPFRKIAHDTGSWTNHVGIVIDASGAEPIIAESTFPVSKIGPLSKFVARSKAGRMAVSRLNTPLTAAQRSNIKAAALKRLGIFYDTGFNLHSNRQFCSRFVHEVISEAVGINLGKTENFTTLFADNPNADLVFWRIWYFGIIPWKRETVTPASILHSPDLHIIFDGYADNNNAKL
jgi:cell wall-associated NlpC family hydrolase